MRIAIFGASGPTGRRLTAQALESGHSVSAFTRRPEAFPVTHPQLEVVGGDVSDADTVAGVVKGQDAVLSALGVPFSRKPINVYSVGAETIISAMRRHDISRLACVTSNSVEPHPPKEGGLVFRKIMHPILVGFLGKTLYEDMRRMEAAVADSGLDWTIVRPGGLFETEEVTDYRVAEGHAAGRFTSRADLADLLLRQATDREYIGKVIGVATVSTQPTKRQLMQERKNAKRS